MLPSMSTPLNSTEVKIHHKDPVFTAVVPLGSDLKALLSLSDEREDRVHLSEMHGSQFDVSLQQFFQFQAD